MSIIARLPPNALASPDAFVIPRMERLLTINGAEPQAIADREMVSVGKNLREDERIRLRKKHERIGDDRLVATFQIVVAQTPVPGHVGAEHEQVALTLDVRIDDRFDNGHRDADG